MAGMAVAPQMSFGRRLLQPGWIRAAWMTRGRRGVRVRPGRRHPRAVRLGRARGGPARHGHPDRRAARVPRRHRRVRLLGPVHHRRAHEARRPRRPRRAQLEGLLQGQHRPQGDRRPVRGHRAVLHVRRRGAGRDHPGRAGAARAADRRPEHLQRPVLGPRGADDLPGRHPDLRGTRELRAAADDRRARHGVPAPERAQLLAAAGGGRDDDRELPGAGRRRLQHRLDGLRAAVRQRATGPAVLHDRRAVRGHVVDHDRAQLHRHDHHDARARHDVLAHAAARLGQLLDVAARRDRDAVRRGLAVPACCSTARCTRTSSTRRRAAT